MPDNGRANAAKVFDSSIMDLNRQTIPPKRDTAPSNARNVTPQNVTPAFKRGGAVKITATATVPTKPTKATKPTKTTAKKMAAGHADAKEDKKMIKKMVKPSAMKKGMKDGGKACYAAGGVAKYRHGAATASGAPKQQPRNKVNRG